MPTPLLKVEDAPIEVPSLVANDAPLVPSQYEWLNDTGWDRNSVGDESQVVLPLVPYEAKLAFDLSPGPRPLTILVTSFSRLNEKGLPEGAHDSQIECTGSLSCKLVETDSQVQFEADLSRTTRIVMVYAEHFRLSEGADEPPTLVSLSWAFRIVE